MVYDHMQADLCVVVASRVFHCGHPSVVTVGVGDMVFESV